MAGMMSGMFNLSALRAGARFVFLKPEVEAGRRAKIEGVVLGPGSAGGIAILLAASDAEDEWSGMTYVMPLTTSAVRY